MSTPSHPNPPFSTMTLRDSNPPGAVMTPPDVTPVSEALSWLAAQNTADERQARAGEPWEWSDLTAEKRVAKMGERARSRDAAILNAREALTRAAADGGVAPPGWKLVPVEPTEEMWGSGSLARAMMMWLDMGRPTPSALFQHLDRSGVAVPEWLHDEPEMAPYRTGHVVSKGTRCVLLYRAMLSAAPPPPVAAADGRVAGWRNMDSAPKDGTEFWALTDDTSGNDLPPFVSRCAYHPDAGFCTDELREPILWRPGNSAAPPPPVVAGSDDLRAENERLRLTYKTGHTEGYTDATDDGTGNGYCDHDAAEEGWQQYLSRNNEVQK